MRNANTHHRLVTALLRCGEAELARIWGVDKSEVSRRINGQRGIKLPDLASALDVLGFQLVLPTDDVEVVDREMLVALKTLARKGLEGAGNE